MIETIFEGIVFIAALALISFLIILILITKKNKDSLVKSVIQLEADKIIILDRLEKISSELDVKKLENTDEFVAFLSQSRDWAFEYIEDVQIAIKYLKNAMSTDNKEEIKLAYAHLVELLPKDENDSQEEPKK
jgi:short subunit fatty acids transporter